MIRHNLTPLVKTTRYAAPVSAGTDGSRVNLTEIDLQNYPQGFRIIAVLGAVTSGGIFTMGAKGSATTATYGSGTVDDLTGATIAKTDAGTSVVILEVTKPVDGCRFVRPYYQRTVANVVIESIILERIGSEVPITEANATVVSAPAKSTT